MGRKRFLSTVSSQNCFGLLSYGLKKIRTFLRFGAIAGYYKSMILNHIGEYLTACEMLWKGNGDFPSLSLTLRGKRGVTPMGDDGLAGQGGHV